MPLYEDRTNSENRIKISPEASNSVVNGNDSVAEKFINIIRTASVKKKGTLKVSLDGWYGVNWDILCSLLSEKAKVAKISIRFEKFSTVYKSVEELAGYKKEFITDDPGFGWANTEGSIEDIIDEDKLVELKSRISAVEDIDAVFVFGYGTSIAEMKNEYDLCFYADMTMQQLLWKMWEGELIPFGQDSKLENYGWKEYYYCDFYLLYKHKPFAFKNMDYYVDMTDTDEIKILPRTTYDEIISTMVKYPVKQVKIFQPGPWGAYRHKDLYNVEGLEINAWNELAGPELNILVDVGNNCLINMPVTNLLEHDEVFVGPYLAKTLPGLIPFDIWLDDGYFPEPVPQERRSMPIHNHPHTDYVKRHFNEPLGRYETYYIAEAYEGANTMMGLKRDADLEEWEEKCRVSWEKKETIEDWKDYIKIWPTNVGDLFLIPPGTTHGHGGNQMILEMDTVCSPCGTEYSFFMYDFMRPSWDDKKKTMTGKPVNMHLEHGFDNDKWRTEDYVNENLRLRQPEVVKWTKEYAIDRYQMIKEMPFEIERIHFNERAEYDTLGRFMHIATLVNGKRIKIRSKANPELETELNLWQSCMIPAGFGDYECINLSEGSCCIALLRWRKG